MSQKKKVKPREVTIDYQEWALVANYVTEYLDMNGVVIDAVPGSKKVRLPKDFVESEITELSEEVVEKCKYIPSSKVHDVQNLMSQMLTNRASNNGNNNMNFQNDSMNQQQNQQNMQQSNQNNSIATRERVQTTLAAAQAAQAQQINQQGIGLQGGPGSNSMIGPHGQMMPYGQVIPQHQPRGLHNLLPLATFNEVDEYCDALYEDKMDLKVRGAKCILRLCLDHPRNLELLGNHESLMGVLSRELRENYKKSHDIATSICCIVLCFSAFGVFHSTLMQHQCGDVSMRIVEYESKRYQVRKSEREAWIVQLNHLKQITNSNNNNNNNNFENKTSESDPNNAQDQQRRLEKEEKKYQHQLLRQNKLLHTVLHILMNLAEDVHIEKKMVNRQLASFLCQLLDRSMEELLFVALTFLKKLSIFEENKDEMFRNDVVPKLVQLAHHHSAYIALLALRVLYNLSFDESVTSSLAENGELFQQLVDLLRHPPFRQLVLKLLYHFTRDDRCKSLLTYHPDCLLMLLQLIVHFPDQTKVGKDLVALSINLALHPRAAELMVVCQLQSKETNSVEFLWPQVVLRIMRTRDSLLCRVMRHITMHSNVRQTMLKLLEHARMSKWSHELVRVANSSLDQPDFLVEVLGTLANFSNTNNNSNSTNGVGANNNNSNEVQINWGELCESDVGLIDLLHRLLVGGFSEDDLVLEAIIVVGLIANDDEGSRLLSCQPKFILVLLDLFSEKSEDDEICLQLLYTFQVLVLNDEIRDLLLNQNHNLNNHRLSLTSYVMDLMSSSTLDRCSMVRKQASATLQTIAELEKGANLNNMNDGPGSGRNDWSDGISAMKFEIYNQQWLAATANLGSSNANHLGPGGSHGGGGYNANSSDLNVSGEHGHPGPGQVNSGDRDHLNYGLYSEDSRGSMGIQWEQGGTLQWDVAEGLAERDWMTMEGYD